MLSKLCKQDASLIKRVQKSSQAFCFEIFDVLFIFKMNVSDLYRGIPAKATVGAKTCCLIQQTWPKLLVLFGAD